jgi:hypothetical protein
MRDSFGPGARTELGRGYGAFRGSLLDSVFFSFSFSLAATAFATIELRRTGTAFSTSFSFSFSLSLSLSLSLSILSLLSFCPFSFSFSFSFSSSKLFFDPPKKLPSDNLAGSFLSFSLSIFFFSKPDAAVILSILIFPIIFSEFEFVF